MTTKKHITCWTYTTEAPVDEPLFLRTYSADEAVQQISRMMTEEGTDTNEEDMDEDIEDDF